MSIIEALILGLIQGITEFLPVSSSGHLVITETLFGITDHNLAIAIILHVGTFFAIVAAYWNSVVNLIKEFGLMVFDLVRLKGFGFKKSKYRYYIIFIVIGTIPAAIFGVLFDDMIESAFSEIYVVAFTLFLTGLILLVGEKIGAKNTGNIEQLGPVKSFLVGVFQMFAIIPGISRSGTTMVGGLVFGLKKEEALEFSFLLALPAILGSVVLNLSDLSGAIGSISILPVIVGFLTAFIAGYLSIKLFKLIVQKGSILIFSVYCWVVSLLLVVNIGHF